MVIADATLKVDTAVGDGPGTFVGVEVAEKDDIHAVLLVEGHDPTGVGVVQVIFRLDHAAVNIAWLLIMVGVADASVLSGSSLRLHRLGGAVFVAVLAGTLLPVLVVPGVADATVARLDTAKR